MAKKLGRNAFPDSHSENDFDAFGPAATKDGEFEGTYLADMGCFMQEEVDSNKYYHGGVYQSKINQKFYFYVEYGRVGAGNPQIQFTECISKDEAQREFAKQMKSKNISRGTWETHVTLGQRLIPKIDSKGKSKDLYLVRAQATRSTGLPAARTIKTAEGMTQPKALTTKKTNGKKSSVTDQITISLMRDLNVATIQYTKGIMSDDALPTQTAVDQGRSILQEARKCVKRVGRDLDAQVGDKEIKQLTRDLYSIIPKKKGRNDAADTWILSENNIDLWKLDLDAFESALYATDLGTAQDDPFGGMRIEMHSLGKTTTAGEFIINWMSSATRNVHSHVSGLKIRNVFYVERDGDQQRLTKAQNEIIVTKKRGRETPLHQPKSRPDLDRATAKRFVQSNTALMFHGTRSVNVSGILRESLRLPRQLVGVATNGAMFGPGLYFADDWKKSAGYCSTRNSYYAHGSSVANRGAFMFLCDVSLGKCHVADDAHGYTRAPGDCHSVFGKMNHTGSWGGSLMNNEFIVYKSDQQRLRYLIEFDA